MEGEEPQHERLTACCHGYSPRQCTPPPPPPPPPATTPPLRPRAPEEQGAYGARSGGQGRAPRRRRGRGPRKPVAVLLEGEGGESQGPAAERRQAPAERGGARRRPREAVGQPHEQQGQERVGAVHVHEEAQGEEQRRPEPPRARRRPAQQDPPSSSWSCCCSA